MRATLLILLVTAACVGKRSAAAPAARPGGLPVSLPTVGAVMMEPREPRPGKPVTTRALAAVGLDPEALDVTADPCDDFYQFACGDAAGNLVNWWQPDTERQFEQRTRCVIDQYSGYEVGGGTRLNGASTVGENIADIGGVQLALAAYRQLRGAAPGAVVADGFTEDQQFFLGFGQAWCAKARPDYEQLLALVDVHAPPRWRVNGALAATPEFARAFRCKTGSKMVPAKQCVIW